MKQRFCDKQQGLVLAGAGAVPEWPVQAGCPTGCSPFVFAVTHFARCLPEPRDLGETAGERNAPRQHGENTRQCLPAATASTGCSQPGLAMATSRLAMAGPSWPGPSWPGPRSTKDTSPGPAPGEALSSCGLKGLLE